MVYSLESTRSKMRNLQIAHDMHTTSLNSLPAELLLQITGNCTNDEVLHFRCVSKRASKVCTTEIAQRFSRLYIHSSPRSIARALEICHSDTLSLWRDAIKEVVLLGRMSFRVLDRMYNGRVIDPKETRFQPWPRNWTPKLPYTEETGNISSQDLCTLLSSSLARLPKLKKLSYEHSPSCPGFNQPSKDVVKDTALRATEHKPACSDLRRSDLDLLLAITMAEQLQITELAIGLELPVILGSTSVRCWMDPSATCPNSVTNLTSLALQIDAGWSDTPPHKLYAQLIRSTRALQSLTITIRSNACMKGLHRDKAIATLLPNKPRLRHLHTLNLIYPLPTYKCTSRPSRPSIQAFDFAAFLRRHSRTLREVHIENILFTPHGTMAIDSTLSKMMDCLFLLAEICPGRLHWRLPRFESDPRCRQVNCLGTTCRFNCLAVVQPMYIGDLDFIRLDRFAASVGVEKDGEGNREGWNFGKALVERDLKED